MYAMCIFFSRGLYPVPSGATEVLGLEMAGTIVEVGPRCELDFTKGDRVMSVRRSFITFFSTCLVYPLLSPQLLSGGGYAEYVSVHESLLMRVPEHMPLSTVRCRML